MSTIFTAQRHYILIGTILAMAAIILAVALTAGPTMAQDGADANANHYDSPVPCSEETEPDDTTARVITEGFVPIFEGFWDYEVGHLSNNFCPPKVTETEGPLDPVTFLPTTVYDRTDANTHISETAFSIPDSYKVTVIDTRPETVNGNPGDVEGPTIDIADYPFLEEAVSAVTENGTFAHTPLWWVRLDDPDTGVEASPLQLGLSTALMDPADWYKNEDEDPDVPEPPVQFRFSAVHVLEAGVPVETHVRGANFFAFKEREEGDIVQEPLWSDSQTAPFSVIEMEAGQYQPLQFAFTKPGEYLVQVNVQGHVRNSDDPAPDPLPQNWDPISDERSITSPVQWYTLHVGPEADLGVTMTHTDETSDAGTTVTDRTAEFSVTATNHGPETAEGVVVEVSLPVGLDYSPPDPAPANIDYQCGVISWRVGNLDPGASLDLDFTAVIGLGGPKAFTVDAEVHSSTVDDNELNDTASVEVRTNSTVVTPPFFPGFPGVTLEIVEHADAGAHAGDPVAAINPDGRELHYSLSGRCSNWFQVHSNGQIVLASGRELDYDQQSEFHLTLHVSDGVNADGTTDTDRLADDSIPVLIQVIDTEETAHPSVTFKLTLPDSEEPLTGNPVADERTYFLRTTLHDAPAGVPLIYDWEEEGWYNPLWNNRFHTSYFPASEYQPGTKTYTVHIKWPGGGISAEHSVTFVRR